MTNANLLLVLVFFEAIIGDSSASTSLYLDVLWNLDYHLMKEFGITEE